MQLRGCWHRLRVALFLRSVQCRHDGTPPLCLWCGIASVDVPLLANQPVGQPLPRDMTSQRTDSHAN